MEKRQKASDVFRETDFFMAKKSPFEEAFLDISDIRIEVTERKNFSSADRKRYYGKDASEYVDCSNPACYNGGFRLGALIRNMVNRGQTELETTEFCQGYHGSPKGRRNYGPCEHRFKVIIKIKYKEDDPDTEELKAVEQE